MAIGGRASRSRKTLFGPVTAKKTHVAFDALRGMSFLNGARRLMENLFVRMGDPDGNFIEQFQGFGFHSRVFELACFGYLEESGWAIQRGRPNPDFIVEKAGVKVAIEAVTTNPTGGRDTDIALTQLPDPRGVDMFTKCADEFPIRMGGVLREKLKKEYWKRLECEGLPFVLIVAPFHEPGSTTYIDEQLARYLYGVDQFTDWTERNGVLVREAEVKSHTFEGKTIPSNFFGRDERAANLSAVLWCNQFTVPRFARLSMESCGLPDELDAAIVKGWHALDETPPYERFRYELGDPDMPPERWSRGATLFLNPTARVPVAPEAFEVTSTFRFQNGRLQRALHDFHPLIAMTTWHGPPLAAHPTEARTGEQD